LWLVMLGRDPSTTLSQKRQTKAAAAQFDIAGAAGGAVNELIDAEARERIGAEMSRRYAILFISADEKNIPSSDVARPLINVSFIRYFEISGQFLSSA
jgi:hypothetical protein